MTYSENISKWSLYLLIFLVVVLTGCTRYYKPVAADSSTPEAKENLIVTSNGEKIMILRHGRYSYVIDTFSVDNVAMTMSSTLRKLYPTVRQYVDAIPRHYGYTDTMVLKQMHIYTRDTSALDITKVYTVPFDQIYKIELIEHDTGRTSGSMLLGAGITLGVIAGLVVAVSTAEVSISCPYISTYDGDEYILQGELFAGAIKRSLERQDFMPLNVQPHNGGFQLRISNELKEKQFTNYADLIVIEHDSAKRAVVGTDGKIYLLSNPVSPASAVLNDQRNVVGSVNKMDELSCSFDDTIYNSTRTDLTLTFNSAPGKENARLVLNLKNTLWLEYLYNEFATSFAGRYDQWQGKLDRQKPEELYQWLEEQQVPLTISMSTSTGWKEVTKLNTIGPLMNREVVVPIELEKNSDDPIRIKLSTGFLFWEVDYAALDFTKNEPVVTTTLKPYSAIDDKGKDVLSELVADDQLYLTQPETGNYAILKYKFDKVPAPGKSYSVVLSASGYYEPIMELEGKADLSFLRKFRNPGAMNAFSEEKYQSIFENTPAVVFQQH